MPKCIILSGAPLSGKSTYARKHFQIQNLSCDIIRLRKNPGKYVFDPKIEKEVWDEFYSRLNQLENDVIIDNTNCKLSYINKIKENLNKNLEWDVEIVKFEVGLLKSYYRNIKRWIFTGKWIPFKVIKDMKNNYKKLWKNV